MIICFFPHLFRSSYRPEVSRKSKWTVVHLFSLFQVSQGSCRDNRHPNCHDESEKRFSTQRSVIGIARSFLVRFEAEKTVHPQMLRTKKWAILWLRLRRICDANRRFCEADFFCVSNRTRRLFPFAEWICRITETESLELFRKCMSEINISRT